MVFLLCAEYITLSGLSETVASPCATGVIRLSVWQSLMPDPDINSYIIPVENIFNLENLTVKKSRVEYFLQNRKKNPK